MFKLIFFFLISVQCFRKEPLQHSIANKLNKVVFLYPNDVQSERDLMICPENAACNIIHKRFWLPPIVERLCRCPQRRECRSTWSNDTDNYTMTLDNRSQIKFCSDLSELPKCTIKKPAIKIVMQSPNTDINMTLTAKSKNSPKTSRHTAIRNVTALCNCQDPHYWKLKANSTKYDEDADQMQQIYLCSKLKKCSPYEFCGYVRTDTYSIFYRCSCPKEHFCIARNKTVYRAEEMLFSGHVYKAICHPVNN